ncbi:putative undecaprenyl-diphosphatase YbjG [Marinobacterium sp. xm-a-121]|nr:putative undecaprenyl-diphosphatase YbjG [Marinobacterium sp. xm-d-420]NRP39366.1 putative undecaprenyl-diphosphatase YbjG [Marinobacterium sp. xm-a-121]NRP47701.1 putative undecaprenyl-diphosphatase YbjG [Marinobacterium sp. xm-d-543]NRP56912.1 putative undecaprenyl-diphosphatase YbjG [Marinobacterium sp. xm-d-510]NRP96299.1 putative undecaprenyl-diphosphatase YbjG [Marinobacterium sp. xm-a-127]NRQ00317.1 putative undecaprenyl-diphosphatase YbjG [Marinobacterium sp. xm-v-233]NRQ23727.1 pu
MLMDLDQSLFQLINKSLGNPIFDWIMPLLTHLGDKEVVWGLIALIGVSIPAERFVSSSMGIPVSNRVSGIQSKLRVLALLALIYGVNAGVYSAVKVAVDRDRPFEQNLAELRVDQHEAQSLSSNGSFPSGHSANSMMLATILAFAFVRLRWVFFSIAILVAFSRIYLGVHFPLDTMVGAGIGGLVSYLLLKSKFSSMILVTRWNKD